MKRVQIFARKSFNTISTTSTDMSTQVETSDHKELLYRKRLDQSKSPRVRLQRLEKCLDLR